MSRSYRCLSQQAFTYGNYELLPIRDEDKYSIMQWRNDQLNVLRQKEPLTRKQQEVYFRTVVDKLFDQEKPDQLLFSFLEGHALVGYGGLVHIDWQSKNAEISFLTATQRNEDQNQFQNDWRAYLTILKKQVAVALDMRKIYTYAYDIRTLLFPVLQESGFIEEARLKDHVSIRGSWHDVVIHAYFIDELSFRMATKQDALLYFDWANDPEVRNNSFHSDPIDYEEHCKWFFAKLDSGQCHFYLFSNGRHEPVGQVRIEVRDGESIVGVSIDKRFRGKSYSNNMLIQATDHFLTNYPNETVVAYVKLENSHSYKAFISSGFIEQSTENREGIPSYKLIKRK